MAQSLIKIVTFKYCTDDRCTFSKDKHLLIQEEIVEIERDKAVALSYTWGDFNRHDVPIGHGKNQTPIILNLGQEWVVSDVIDRLQEICLGDKGCWIDQICVPQRDDQIRETLAAIPTIYRTLDVVILLPSAPCKCFYQAADSVAEVWESMTLLTSEAERHGEELRINKIVSEGIMQRDCLNILPLNSWLQRLWTRQELMYSSKVSLLYASKKQAPCLSVQQLNQGMMRGMQLSLQRRMRTGIVTPVTEFDIVSCLQPSAALKFCSVLNSGAHLLSAVQAIQLFKESFFHEGINVAFEYTYGRSQYTGALASLLRLFSGGEIETVKKPDAKSDRDIATRLFFMQLVTLGSTSRLATQSWDLVAAVWVDCPGYQLPPDYKSKEVGALLEDAVLQLEHKSGTSPTTTAPAGLFSDNCEHSGLWRPSKYLNDAMVEDTCGLYAVTTVYPAIKTNSGRIELANGDCKASALSLEASSFRKAFDGLDTARVFQIMARLSKEWADAQVPHKLRWAVKHYIKNKNPSADVAARFIMGLIESNKEQGGNASSPSWQGQEFDHLPIIYHIVTILLGLDVDLCQRHGMDVVVSEQTQSIGLLRASANGKSQVANNATILIHSDAKSQLAYEAELLDTTSPAKIPEYRICGVWIPTRQLKPENINFYAKDDGEDACIA